MQKKLLLFGIAAVIATAMACGEKAATPVSPSPTTSTGSDAAADGSTLKATAPVPYSPANGSVVSSLTPNLVVTNSTLKFADAQTASTLRYRFVVETPAGAPVVNMTEPTTPGGYAELGITGARVPVDLLQQGTAYRWRARAELGSSVGPWSSLSSFTTQVQSPSTLRTIPIVEAVQIIRTIYDQLGYKIGSGSTREQRNVYLERAVAALHYGHVRFNPLGRDPNWCIKNGGPGRPQADDVIARCDTRDAWDLVASIGADSYYWHTDYLGRLPGDQAVYPPSASALDGLPR